MQKFAEKVALITGGTSGIGQTTAIAFAKLGAKIVVAGRSEDDGQETLRLIQETGEEGIFVKADLTQASEVELLVNKAVETYGRLDCAFNNAAVMYNQSDDDAHTTRKMVEKHSRQCHLIKGDVRSKQQCQEAISQIIEQFGKLNILVNNAAFQQSHENFEEVSEEEIRRTFETNIFGYMFMAQAALPHLTEGDVIINTGSTTALLGHPTLIPYSATKGAIPRVHQVTSS
ncbi:MAG: SDR family NAD(P)-dependent oxidoreductase [Calothrix sp. FI2-JRJ7]|jgi:NAD(P)-dependent dehydrogenase (short-subunit alcohol dehydrogenase family)|nr:SDR family NAD(P)-dependent oxidoreductase [Calothrix sp. FI2-JRJ7]